MSFRPLNNPLLRSADGFTLIEVMISVVILAFISLGIYQLTTETYHLRDVISAEGEFYNSIRMSMDIVGRDVMTMFNPTMMLPPKTKPSPSPQNPNGAAPTELSPAETKALQAITASDQGALTDFWRPASDPTALRPSRFVGTSDKMSFISVSHIRIYKDAPESDFAKITYQMIKDEDNRDAPDSMVLLKTESTDAFDNDDRRDQRYQHKFPLLHGIKHLKYRYWRKDSSPTGKWESSWDSDKEEYRDQVPDMIEVTFEVNGPMRLSFSGIFDFRPEVPLRGLDPST